MTVSCHSEAGLTCRRISFWVQQPDFVLFEIIPETGLVEDVGGEVAEEGTAHVDSTKYYVDVEINFHVTDYDKYTVMSIRASRVSLPHSGLDPESPGSSKG